MSQLKDNRTFTLLEQYLTYLTVVKGRSQLTAYECRYAVANPHTHKEARNGVAGWRVLIL